MSSSAPVNSGIGSERRRDQTVHGQTTIILLNQNPPQTLDHHLELNPQHQINRPRRDPDQDPDLVSATIGATVAATSNRSSRKSSPRQQLAPTVARPTLSTIIGSSADPLIRYRECLKNHAANMGGHVVDGCGEFMSSGEDGTPGALKCAACECHRNFHRKEINGESQYATAPLPPSCYITYNPYKNKTRRDAVHPQQPNPLHQQRFSIGLSTSPSTVPVAPLMMNFGGGGGNGGGPTESSSQDLNMFHSNAGGGQSSHQKSSKKRFRTKFSQEQKDKMVEFAEKLGWRIQKQDEPEVQQFVAQVGVKRQVFKVWMHNNRQAMKKKHM